MRRRGFLLLALVLVAVIVPINLPDGGHVGAALASLAPFAVSLKPSGVQFQVDSQTDAVDANPGDGICLTGAGQCTLRAAIQEANALAGSNSIQIPAGVYTLTLPGANDDKASTGDLDVTKNLDLQGSGAGSTVIDGNGAGLADRVLDVLTGTVNISGITLQNGSGWLFGAGLRVGPAAEVALNDVIIASNVTTRTGGGLQNYGALTINNSVITNNQAGTGGGIFNQGILTLTNTLISDNAAPDGGGGGIANGASAGTFLISHSQIASNTAGTGGGLYIFNPGTTSVVDSDVLSNTSVTPAGGGGVFNLGSNLIFDRSTIRWNVSLSGTLGGGGIANFGFLTVTNSLVADNLAIGGKGGGIMSCCSAVLSITNSTFTNNSGTNGSALHLDAYALTTTVAFSTIDGNQGAGGPAVYSNGLVWLRGTIVSENVGGNCTGTIHSLGHNLDSANSCQFQTPAGDLINTDPLLDLLGDNGGTTWTKALLAGSSAIDAGGNAGCPPLDQRGYARPIDGNSDGSAVCDIGAYEYASVLPTATPTSTDTPTATNTPTATTTPTPTATPTGTMTPTNTPTATASRTATGTSSPANTLIPPPTPVQVFIPLVRDDPLPTPTPLPTATSTPNIVYPTATPFPSNTPGVRPTHPTPTATQRTQASCSIYPPIVSAYTNTNLLFSCSFAPAKAGYGFSAYTFSPGYSGQHGCGASDGNGDGLASCVGTSGRVPPGRTITVSFDTSVGTKYVTYQTYPP